MSQERMNEKSELRQAESLDKTLMDLLNAMVDEQGRMQAARSLGVNHQTLAKTLKDGKLTARVRVALQVELAFNMRADIDKILTRLETAEGLLGQLEDILSRLTVLERREEAVGNPEVSDQDEPVSASLPLGNRFRLRVVSEEPQPGEDWGAAAHMVDEWRGLKRSHPDRGRGLEWATDEVRVLEIELTLLTQFYLTLPPVTEPLTATMREDAVAWRRDALKGARKNETKQKWLALARRVLTLGRSRAKRERPFK